MLKMLRSRLLPWDRIHVAQVDERIAPAGDPRRNLCAYATSWSRTDLCPSATCSRCQSRKSISRLRARRTKWRSKPSRARHSGSTWCSSGSVWTATRRRSCRMTPSWTCERRRRDQSTYQGTARMTLTYPALDRARARLWLVTGDNKRPALQDLLSGHGDTPAARVATDSSTIVTDILRDGAAAYNAVAQLATRRFAECLACAINATPRRIRTQLGRARPVWCRRSHRVTAEGLAHAREQPVGVVGAALARESLHQRHRHHRRRHA